MYWTIKIEEKDKINKENEINNLLKYNNTNTNTNTNSNFNVNDNDNEDASAIFDNSFSFNKSNTFIEKNEITKYDKQVYINLNGLPLEFGKVNTFSIIETNHEDLEIYSGENTSILTTIEINRDSSKDKQLNFLSNLIFLKNDKKVLISQPIKTSSNFLNFKFGNLGLIR